MQLNGLNKFVALIKIYIYWAFCNLIYYFKMSFGSEEFHLEEPSFYNVVLGFYHAVDWQEPFILCILVFHVICYLTFLLLRKKTIVQLLLWFLSC